MSLKIAVDNLSGVSASIRTLLRLATGRGTAFTVRTALVQKAELDTPASSGATRSKEETTPQVAAILKSPVDMKSYDDSDFSEIEQSSYLVFTKDYTEIIPSSLPESRAK